MNDRMMFKPVGIMPNHLDVREITYSNLLLLEFNPSDMESKYRVVFNRDMFALPNKKAMEVVMHFLFTRLHPQLAYEEFRDCWPVRDKVLEQQFRKVCFNWVSRIQKEDPEARLPRIVQSLFHSPGGDRFYSFLHHFSLYVLVKVMFHDHGKIGSIPTFPTKTIHNQSFTHVMSKALEAHYIVLKKRFLEFTQCAVVVENHWKDFAVETTKEFRALVKKKRELERQIRQLDGSVSSHGVARVKTDYEEEIEALKRTQNLQKQIQNLSRKIATIRGENKMVRDLWASIEEFYSVQTPHRQIVDSVLRGDANKYKIDASDIQPRVPDLLLRDSEKEIRMKNIGNTFVSGKVNLLSLIQLWNLSLNKIKEQLYQGPIPNLGEDLPAVRSALHTHHAHLKNSKTLREAVQDTIPTMKEHINQMKSHCYKALEESHNCPQEKHVTFNLGLGLVPPTPPLSFAAADTPAAERITSFQDMLKLSPETVSTPDVIQAWTKSVRGQQSASKEVSSSKKEVKKREPSRLPRPKQQLTQQDLVSPLPKVSKDTSRARLRSHNILADQIADAVTVDQSDSTSLSSSAPSSRASTPKVQALEDPIGALGQDAFQPRDLIPRTPAKTEAGHPLSSHRTPSGDKRSVRQPWTASQSGGLLETILDHSEEQSTPISASRELHRAGAATWHGTIQLQRENVPHHSGKPRTPVSVKTALFKETPSSLHGQSLLNYSSGQTPGFTMKEFLLDTSPHESESTSLFNLSEVQQTPKLVETSLFGETTTPEGETHTFNFGFDHAPAPAKTPLCQGTSPGLGALLLPRGTILDHSEGDLLHSAAKHNVSPLLSRYGDYENVGEGFTPASVKAAPSPRFQELLLHQESLGSHSTMAAVRGTPSSQRSLQRAVMHDVRGIDQIIKVTGLPSTPTIGSIEAETPMDPDTWPTSKTVGPSLDTETPRQPSTVASHQQLESSRSENVSSVNTSIRALNKDSSASHADHSPAYEVDTRALIERLNKIKLTQQSTDSFLFTPTRHLQSSGQENTLRLENTVGGLSDTSLLANRLDQIKQAQRSQQVTPGSNTGEDQSASRPSEAALLTPLTTSSRETPSEEEARTTVTKFTFYSPHYSFSPPGSPCPSPDEKSQSATPFETDQEFVSPSQGIALSFSSEVGFAEGDLGLLDGFHWETATPSLPQRHTKRGCLDDESSPPIIKLNEIPHSPFSYDPSTPLSINSDGRPNIKTTVAEAQLFPGSINGFTQQGTLGNDYTTPVKHDGPLSPVIGQLIDLE